MSLYEEGIKLLDEMFGGGKDNQLALATIAREPNADGAPRPVVRAVDAVYDNGTFYAVTYAKSNKVLQIEQNKEISIAFCSEMFTASGWGENLGWVLDPKNAEIRTKLRAAFSAWYDAANNENDENCVFVALHLTKGMLNINHWEKLYFLDFEKKDTMENYGIY